MEQIARFNIEEQPAKKRALVGAAVQLMLKGGYASTTVDDICAEAGVTKGSFFHYFASKEEISRTAIQLWATYWRQVLDSAKLETIADPLERLHRLFDVMGQAYTSQDNSGCLVGTLAQELSHPNVSMRILCHACFEDWVDGTAKLLADARRAHPPSIDFDPREVAWWLQSMVQGTLLISKSSRSNDFILVNIRHCRTYIDTLFGCEPSDLDL